MIYFVSLEYIRGPISEVSFGQVVAETAWETFGILCKFILLYIFIILYCQSYLFYFKYC